MKTEDIPTPETDAFYRADWQNMPGTNFARTLERQRNEARQQALDMAAQVLALRKGLALALESMDCVYDMDGEPMNESDAAMHCRNALSDPPPPVVPLAEHERVKADLAAAERRAERAMADQLHMQQQATAENGVLRAAWNAAEQDAETLAEALENHAGWSLAFDKKTSKELPMVRPEPARSALAAHNDRINPKAAEALALK